ncbi:MAG: trypsin-like peptidase domain-containing protein [Chloroflexi bacterium]|nr:trypsin-like peptidase domain-containing protein [Chloroflexota bacterium]MCL5275996.1 trypsin-like peptidase domain-containing protein [Chloroflexota bacterium]
MRRYPLLLSGLTVLILGCSLVPRIGGPAAPTAIAAPMIVTAAPIIITATPGPTATPIIKVVNELEDLYVNLYEQASPSVVHITSLSQVFDFYRGAVPQEGTGSGFVYDDQGHIVTNQHVIDQAQDVEVVLADGTSAKATIVGSDAYNDLAVLKIDGVNPALLKPLPLGESSRLKVGMRVIAIGNPFGLDRTLTTGVISALGRTIERDNQAALGEMIQTDAAINPGNSGGPLINLQGQIIGVNSSIQSPSGGSVGIGFAVPIDTVKRIVPQLIATGKVVHPSLGFNAYEINGDLADALKLPVQKGLLIAQVQSGSAAEKAGVHGATQRLRTYGGYILTGGDILTAIDDKPIYTRDAMTIYLETTKHAGDTVKLTLIRGNATITLNAVLDAK